MPFLFDSGSIGSGLFAKSLPAETSFEKQHTRITADAAETAADTTHDDSGGGFRRLENHFPFMGPMYSSATTTSSNHTEFTFFCSLTPFCLPAFSVT